jgi:hypothetical protein
MGGFDRMKRILEKIPTYWVLVCLFFSLGFLGHHIFDKVTGHGTNQEQEVTIPKDLEDCFAELKKILKPEDVQKMREGTEGDMIQYHHGLGTWMRNNWGLWRGSRLSEWFNERGVEHPDDMSGIILTSFWRHLNGKPIGLEEQIKFYRGFWQEEVEPELSSIAI